MTTSGVVKLRRRVFLCHFLCVFSALYEIIGRQMLEIFFGTAPCAFQALTPISCTQLKHSFCTGCPQNYPPWTQAWASTRGSADGFGRGQGAAPTAPQWGRLPPPPKGRGTCA